MRQQSPAALALRAAIILLISISMIVVGVAFDILAGTSPFGLVSFMVTGVVFGTVMISVIILSSFPKPVQDDQDEGEAMGSQQVSSLSHGSER
jgi:F0F1-type ATP synthase assembly protein I